MLSEPVTARLLIASAAMLGGVAIVLANPTPGINKGSRPTSAVVSMTNRPFVTSDARAEACSLTPKRSPQACQHRCHLRYAVSRLGVAWRGVTWTRSASSLKPAESAAATEAGRCSDQAGYNDPDS